MWPPLPSLRGPQRTPASVVAGLAAVVVVVCGCRSEGVNPGGDKARSSVKAPSDVAGTTKPQPLIRRGAGDRGTATRSGRAGGSRRVVTGAGSVYRLPPPPRQTVSKPGRKCVGVRSALGQRNDLALPPTPGLRARRINPSRVRVSYRFHPVPRFCAPARIKLSVDVSDDALPGSAIYTEVTSRRGTATVPVPDNLRRADVLRVTVYTRRFLQSRSAAVLIR